MADMLMNQKRRYLSYLLRLWQEGGDETPLWRASLQSPQSEEVQGFADLDEIVAFLRERIGRELPLTGFERDERVVIENDESKED